jgi:mRNA interferase RelE/StbE
MSWVCELSGSAAKDLRRLPPADLRRIARAIDGLEQDPMSGDVRHLSGPEWHGCYRKRVGPFRLIFTLESDAMRVIVLSILRRSESTYK